MFRAEVLRWGGARVRRWVACVLAAVMGCVLGMPTEPARAAGSVRIGTVRVDPSPSGALTANTAITFRATGTYTPESAGEPSSLGFLWQFGDGTQVQVAETAGSGPRNSVVTHTYARPGRYKVVCYAYHGTKFNPRTGTTTLDQHVDDFVKIRVFCQGYTPAAGKCKPGTFDAFDGVWNSGDENRGYTVTLDESKSKVRGTIEFHHPIASFTVPVSGKVRVGRTFGGTPAVVITGVGTASPGGGEFRYVLSIVLDREVTTYRKLDLLLVELEARPSPVELRTTLEPAARDDGYSTELCMTVGASSQTVLPGGTFGFRLQLASSGPACFPAGRITVAMLVDGGVIIDPRSAELKGLVAGSLPGGVLFLVDPLGDGPAASAGRASANVVIRADQEADEVRITLIAADPGAAADGKYALVDLPAPRVYCVTVDRPE